MHNLPFSSADFDDIAREVVEDSRQVEPAPTDDFQIGEVGLPKLMAPHWEESDARQPTGQTRCDHPATLDLGRDDRAGTGIEFFVARELSRARLLRRPVFSSPSAPSLSEFRRSGRCLGRIRFKPNRPWYLIPRPSYGHALRRGFQANRYSLRLKTRRRRAFALHFQPMALTMLSTIFLASPNSIVVFGLKNNSLSTPA